MPALTATATCTAFHGILEATGEQITSRRLTRRVGWLATLIQQLADPIVAARWQEADLEVLAARVGPDGRRLPASGWMAMRRLGWAATPLDGTWVSDRIRRVADEAAARTLRLAIHRRGIVRALLATWPQDPRQRTDTEWAALRQRLPDGMTAAEVRNRTRQLAAWQTNHDGRLPAGLTELESPPPVAAVGLLAAADRQLTTIARTGPGTAELRVQLPLVPHPASRGDWAWHVLPLGLPDIVPAEATLCAPTLRVAGHRVRVDLPHRQLVPAASPHGHEVALGLDWGVRTVLTGTVGKLAAAPSGMRVVTDGRRLGFEATGVSAKLHRLRGHRERLATKRNRYAALLGGLPEQDPGGQRAWLGGKHAVLAVEHARVCARIRHLDHALAWAAARWAVDQAIALGATVIYVEDLATLEARGHHRGNARLSGQVRGMILDALGHLAAKAGMPVVSVPARGTSRFCPRCGAELRHVPAPDRPGERGWKWAVCAGCGLSGDRDHAAAERIVARGLLGQAQVRTDPGSGRHVTTTVVDGNVARARRSSVNPKPKPRRRTRAVRRTGRDLPKTRRGRRLRPGVTGSGKRRPARSRPRPAPLPAASATTFRRVPDWHAVPALLSGLDGSKRPAGQAPQPLRPLLGQGGSGPAYDPLPRSSRYRQRQRWDPGWGFHRNVTATLVLVLGDYGPVTAWPRPTVRVA